jgi:hypothetical protein
MLACVVGTLVLHFSAPSGESYAQQLGELREYYFQHPYLDLDKTQVEVVLEGLDETHRAELRSGPRAVAAPTGLAERRTEQDELERRERALGAALADDPLNRWGLVPAHPSPLAFVTSLFLHAGWIHLLGSLLILYLIGPFVEQVWGHPFLLLLYLASGSRRASPGSSAGRNPRSP